MLFLKSDWSLIPSNLPRSMEVGILGDFGMLEGEQNFQNLGGPLLRMVRTAFIDCCPASEIPKYFWKLVIAKLGRTFCMIRSVQRSEDKWHGTNFKCEREMHFCAPCQHFQRKMRESAWSLQNNFCGDFSLFLSRFWKAKSWVEIPACLLASDK